MQSSVRRMVEPPNPTTELRRIKVVYTYFRVLGNLGYAITGTFFVLYLLEFLNFSEIGVLFAVGWFIIAIMDYPTGAWSDSIGPRNVLIIANILFAISGIIFLFSDNFTLFLLSEILAGLGFSQESGALQSWFDNAYREHAQTLDPSRTEYGAFTGSLEMGLRLLGAFGIITSGLIAEFWGRRILFVIELGIVILFLISLPLFLPPHRARSVEKAKKKYREIFKEGLQFLFTSKGHLAIFLGTGITMGVIEGLWGTFILIPLYNEYAITDTLTATLRFITWGCGIIIGLTVISPSKRLKNTRQWLMRLTIPGLAGLFISVTMFYLVFPPGLVFDLVKFIGLALAFNVFGIFTRLREILESRFIIDFVPDETRNSLYSLLATITTLVAIPLSIYGGFVVEINGILGGMILTSIFVLIGTILATVGLHWIQKAFPDSILPETSPGVEESEL